MKKVFMYDYTEWFLNNYKNISEEEFKSGAFISDVYWNFLSCQWRYKLPEDFIDRFNKYLNFKELSKRKNYSNWIIEKYQDRWDWFDLFEHLKRVDTDFLFYTGLNLIKKYNGLYPTIHKRNRITVIFSKYFPLNRIEEIKNFKMIDDLNWEFIEERKDLTRDFINEYISLMDIKHLLNYSNIKKLYTKEELNKFKMLMELNK